MPFQSLAQMKAAFSGALGPKMQQKASMWANETPNISNLPEYAKKRELKGIVKRYNLKKNQNLNPQYAKTSLTKGNS